jgi:hypothetical protein
MLGTTAFAQPEPPKPGPEHEFMKSHEGTWESEVAGADGSKGTMTYKMGVGGLWLLSDYKGSFDGAPFEGRGMDTYDAATKQFVSVWVDSMSTTVLIFKGTLNKEKTQMVQEGEMPGPDGNMMKVKTVTDYKGKDDMTFSMMTPGPDGKDVAMLTINYKRKK